MLCEVPNLRWSCRQSAAELASLLNLTTQVETLPVDAAAAATLPKLVAVVEAPRWHHSSHTAAIYACKAGAVALQTARQDVFRLDVKLKYPGHLEHNLLRRHLRTHRQAGESKPRGAQDHPFILGDDDAAFVRGEGKLIVQVAVPGADRVKSEQPKQSGSTFHRTVNDQPVAPQADVAHPERQTWGLGEPLCPAQTSKPWHGRGDDRAGRAARADNLLVRVELTEARVKEDVDVLPVPQAQRCDVSWTVSEDLRALTGGCHSNLPLDDAKMRRDEVKVDPAASAGHNENGQTLLDDEGDTLSDLVGFECVSLLCVSTLAKDSAHTHGKDVASGRHPQAVFPTQGQVVCNPQQNPRIRHCVLELRHGQRSAGPVRHLHGLVQPPTEHCQRDGRKPPHATGRALGRIALRHQAAGHLQLDERVDTRFRVGVHARQAGQCILVGGEQSSKVVNETEAELDHVLRAKEAPERI
mmetsp:Transcript_12610/g.38597  ORF Transcript_12610/g.38597 Transcript_12610/m.38597 type:complete len:469 (+) Transcript_12610:1611-3017(+)